MNAIELQHLVREFTLREGLSRNVVLAVDDI